MLDRKAIRLDPMKRGLEDFEFEALNYRTFKKNMNIVKYNLNCM